MDDLEFIGYCEIHCTIERALFAAEHVNRMIELAGNPSGFKRQSGWVSAHEEMQGLCDLARARLSPPVPAIAPPVAAGSVDTPAFSAIAAECGKTGDDYTRLLAHIDAWGAQQREAGKVEQAESFREEVEELRNEIRDLREQLKELPA